jgi:hypothetical protein
MNMANRMNIDLSEAILEKLSQNDKKYPPKLVKGKAHKYTYYKNVQ